MCNVLGAYVLGMILAFSASWRVTLIALGISPLMIISGIVNGKLA